MTEIKQISGDCPERVAFDLALKIDDDAPKAKGGPHPGEGGVRVPRDEASWLELYRKCRHLVKHGSVKD